MGRNKVMPLVRSVSLLSVCLMVSACGAGRQIYISSSYHTLPSPGARVSVLGNDMSLVSSAESWLRDRDLYVVTLDSAQSHMTPEGSVPCPKQCNTAAAVEAAKAAGLDYVVLLHLSTEHTPERFSIVISGFDVKSGKEIFAAGGTELLKPENLDDDAPHPGPTLILCHALATVWQYRPGGYSAAASTDYCHIPRPYA